MTTCSAHSGKNPKTQPKSEESYAFAPDVQSDACFAPNLPKFAAARVRTQYYFVWLAQRWFVFLAILLVPICFASAQQAGMSQGHWPSFFIASVTLIFLHSDLRRLQLPRHIHWLPKDVYNAISLRGSYALVLALLPAVLVAGLYVTQALGIHHPRLEDGIATAIATFLSFSAIVSLRGTNAFDRIWAFQLAKELRQESKTRSAQGADVEKCPVGKLCTSTKLAAALSVFEVLLLWGLPKLAATTAAHPPPNHSVHLPDTFTRTQTLAIICTTAMIAGLVTRFALPRFKVLFEPLRQIKQWIIAWVNT